MKWLLWLLFFEDVTSGEVKIEGLRLPNCPGAWGKLFFFLLAVGAIALTIYLYRREPDYVSKRQKRVLAGLRSAALLLILFVCTGAFLDLSRADSSRGSLIMMFDTSLSMSLADRRVTPDEIAPAARALGFEPDALTAADRLTVSNTPRLELVKRAAADPELDLFGTLGEKYDISMFTFGQTAQVTQLDMSASDSPGGTLAKLGAPEEIVTQLGGPLRDAVRRLKGRYVAGVVAFTDGASNRGGDPLVAAGDLGVAVYPVGVGLPETRDIEVPFIFAETVVFKDDVFPILVRVKQRGYAGETVRLVVRRDGEIVKEEMIDLDARTERTHTIELTPHQEGTFTYSAEIEPRDDELSTENNSKSRPGVRVVDRKIRVLVVEDAPRWEFRFLKAVLEADTRRIKPTFVLRQADEDCYRFRDGRFVRDFPATMEELRRYNLIVLGNVPSASFTGDELANVEEYIRKEGGALLVLAGRGAMPDSYVGTPLADLLPVQFEPQMEFRAEDEAAHPIRESFRPQLTPEGKLSAVLRLAPDATENERLWESAEKLYWFHPVERLKPAATALMVHPSQTTMHGPLPLVAHQRYGRGQVMYFGIDETWRWRHEPGAQYHRRMWGQAATYLSMAHLLGETNRVQIETDRAEYATGDTVKIVARIIDESYNPLDAEAVTAIVERGGLERDEVALAAQKESKGVFQGEYRPPAAGAYRVVIQDEEDEAEHEFAVVVPRIEFDDPGMRRDLLEKMAAASGGAFVTIDRLDELEELLAAKKHELEPRREERTLWNAPAIIVLVTALLGIEWLLRKRSDLL
ncbi:MAG: hypothetical protein ACYS9X_02910 [Planctomycetota bacterium]|jgi:hypothetical protein